MASETRKSKVEVDASVLEAAAMEEDAVEDNGGKRRRNEGGKENGCRNERGEPSRSR